jgi:hypothetical protein
MADKNSLLGRSRPSERLSRDEVAALDSATAPPQQRPQPTTPGPAKSAKAQKVQVSVKAVSFRWSAPCPSCGRKVTGQGIPQSGQRLAKCGGCRSQLYLA